MQCTEQPINRFCRKARMKKPLAIDLFCGLGGWTEGLLAEGWEVIGFDIEAHEYGEAKYPATLVLQDVLTLHGSQFKDAALIVASPPCTRCTVEIIQVGIKEIVSYPQKTAPSRWADDLTLARSLLTEAGIRYREVAVPTVELPGAA